MWARRTTLSQDVTRIHRVGLIGVGHMGCVNGRAVAASGVARVVAIADPDRASAAAAAGEHGAVSYGDYRTLLEREDIDIVFVSVPHDLLVAVSLDVVRAGKHVIVEKPVATTLDSFDTLSREAERHSISVTVNYWLRYLPCVQMARRLISLGVLGELAGVAIEDHLHKSRGYWQGTGGFAPDDWRRSKARSGGGMLLMTTCHAIDYLQYLSGTVIERVFSECLSSTKGVEVEDTIAMTFRMSGGAVGTVSASCNMRGARIEQQRLWGTQGTLAFNRQAVEYLSTRPIEGRRPGRWHKIPAKGGEPVGCVAELVRRFCGCLSAGTRPDIDLEAARRTLAVVLAAYESSATGRAVAIPTAGAVAGATA